MPKYYVNDGEQRAVVMADDEIDACVKLLKNVFKTGMENGRYRVTEWGWSSRPNSHISLVDSNHVNEIFVERFGKNS